MRFTGRTDSSVENKELPHVPLKTDGKPGAYRWIRQVSVALWLWELLSLFFSMVCMGAIIVILAHYDNQPIPSWKYGLTINGAISILAVLAKSSLVLPVAEALSQLKWCWFWDRQRPVMDFHRYDSASRGPWGSLTMLFSARLWSVGALGAALTVAAIAVEPCLQQIPAYPSRAVRSGDASIGRSINYTNLEAVSGMSGFELGRSVKGAMYTSIFGDEETTHYEPTCPTGNCTWPAYSSLGVCSACLDLGPLVIPNTYEGPGLWTINSTDPEMKFEWLSESNEEYNLYMQARYENTIRLRGATNHTIVDIQSSYWPAGSRSTNPPSATSECILYFCVKTFTAATVHGEYAETVTATWPGANQTLTGEPDLDSDADFYNADGSDATAAELARKSNYTLEPPGSREQYSVDRVTFELLRQWAAVIFSGSVNSATWNGVNDGGLYGVSDVPQAFFDAQNELLGPNITIAGYSVPSDGGPGKLMAQIATGLTTHMRQTADLDWAVKGDALSVESFVQARWHWAVFPLTLSLLTALFMTATFATCAKAGVPIWKSSCLATLLHGLDERSCQDVTAEKLSDMEGNATAWTMQAQRGESRWMLEGRLHC
ncbi:hypothetical protein LTR36_003402 [Oleoguttula mirabilis]|uniref:Carboxylic ester hydrolase n=1 Tax=Oleoguttula mirabilis TaxID=1507867 RepID=A0AAV9JJ88_9PEZI|nr:hypothetical protein LTR36_003402 [Oleoguttula mirabilis]